MSLRDQYRAIRGGDVERALIAVANVGENAHAGHIQDQLGEWPGVHAYKQLMDLGYIGSEVSLAAEATLTPQGRRLVTHIMQLRSRGGSERNDAVRRVILQGLADHQHVYSLGELLQLVNSDVFGVPTESDEVEENAQALRDMELVTASPTGQGVFLRPRITPRGREALLSSGDETIEEYVRGRGNVVTHDDRSYNNTFNGAVGAVTQGDDAVVTVTQTVSGPDLDKVRALVSQLTTLPRLRDDPKLAAAVAEIEAEVSSDKPKKESILAKLGVAFASAFASSAGQQALPILQEIGSILG